MKKLHVEHANTPLKREQGLMGRKRMGKNNGMLFSFPHSKRLSFWMQNTYLPLEIAFINDNGVITEIKEMVPLSTSAIVSKDNCRYALEVNRGWFDNNNITEGCSVSGIGVGSNSRTNKTAQMTPPATQDQFPVEPGLDVQNPPYPQGVPQQEPSNPDVLLDKTHKEMLEEAHVNGHDLIILYEKSDGYALPPKSISPPFLFVPNAEGQADAVVKAWDNQDASWKSFLVDNIIDLQPQYPIEKNQENIIPEQENQTQVLN